MPLNYRFFVLASLLTAVSLVAPRSLRSEFTDVSAAKGITYQHSLKSESANNHAGAAVVDVNGDGSPDLLFARYKKGPLLYVNDGSGNFAEQSAAYGLSGATDASAFGAADFDNDGDQDIVMSVHEGNRFYFYINDGEGGFTEEAVERGTALQVTERLHKGYSVGFVDYDLDGYLDIYISEWGVSLSSNEEQPMHSALLKNRGAEQPAYFELATGQAGLLQPVNSDRQHGFSSAWADFDGDTWPDLALIVDYGKSQMYWNDGDGTFTNTTKASGVGFDENGMGVAVADYNNDGLLDFYVTSIYDEFSNNKDGSKAGNKLYRNMGGRNFQEVGVSAGVSRTGWGWGTVFFEYNNDGNFDLMATNGSVLSEGGDRNTTPYVDAATDPTTLFINNGDETFTDGTSLSGIVDTRFGKALLVLDWDLDGDEDIVVVNSHSSPVFYESDASESSNDWIRFSFEGTVSNRDGIGTIVKVIDQGVTRTLAFNPSNAYIGQRESVLHFGLGDSGGEVDQVEVKWPTGLVQVYENVTVDQLHHLIEPEDEPAPPLFSKQPTVKSSYYFGEELVLESESIGNPEPVYIWEKDGETLEGQNGPLLRLKRVVPFDAGSYRVKAVNPGGEVYSAEVVVNVALDLDAHSIARWWNEFMLEAIRKDFPDPTKHSRNLYHVSAAMWDAFWAYEEEGWSRAAPMFHREDIEEADWGGDRLAAQKEAISHAAYTVLKKRYLGSPGEERSEAGFRWLMETLGFDPDDDSVEGMEPASVGNRIGVAVLEINYEDGSNELNKYADTSGYESVNEALVLELSGTNMADLNRWQPLAFDFAISQNGIPLGALVQTFLGVNWREVKTFAMRKPTHNTIAFDPGPPPQWGGVGHELYVDSAIEVIRYSSYLDPSSEATIDISPGARLNNSLGTNDGTGRSVNPITNQPYAPNVVKLADYGRLLAEYWADGPASETPPGHWNTLHNEITDLPGFERRYMGKGEALSSLEWDVRAYLALNGGMHDAAVAAWGLKAQYDYSRPISMIRALAEIGQCTDPEELSYDPLGIRIVPGLIEVVTSETAASGQRHEAFADKIGEIVIRAWSGEPSDPYSEVGGVGWILAKDWFPYQRGTFVSPAFAAYVSGHSTFSRSGAEVLTLMTGSPFFPGGLGEFHFEKGEYLEFEYGPSEDVTLQWATYYDASDQAGLSRLYGGIHVRSDDFVGRTLGARIGVEAFLRAHQQRNANANTGLVREIRQVVVPPDRNGTILARFDAESDGLPLRTVQGLLDRSYKEEDGLYFRFSEGTDGEKAKLGSLSLTGVGQLQGADFDVELVEGETFAVEVEVALLEPSIVLAIAEGLPQGGLGVDTQLTLYSVDGDGTLSQVAFNDNWSASDTASQSKVLALRDAGDHEYQETDSMLSVGLESGVYRFEVVSRNGSGKVRLRIRGQGWRSFD